MSESLFVCGNCGFKCVESQLAKSNGSCPKCKKTRKDMSDKFGVAQYL